VAQGRACPLGGSRDSCCRPARPAIECTAIACGSVRGDLRSKVVAGKEFTRTVGSCLFA
jgi:hypothetical protein